MNKTQNLINLVLKAVAVGMSVGAAVLGYLEAASLETQVSLLALGVFALAVASLQQTNVKA